MLRHCFILIIMHGNILCLRAGEVTFVALGMSMRELIETAVQRLKEKYPEGLEAAGVDIPSSTLVTYHMAPKHPLHASALRYTGVYIYIYPACTICMVHICAAMYALLSI